MDPQRKQADWERIARESAGIALAYHHAIPRLRDELKADIDNVRGEMLAGFAMLESLIKSETRVKLSPRQPSDPPRRYTLPVTDTGSIELDKVQDRLDELEREKRDADAHRRVVEGLKQRAMFWVKLTAALLPLATGLGALVAHWAHL